MPIVSAGIETVSLIHGDALSASIAAASIIAKVTRDRMMIELAEQYPQYGLPVTRGMAAGSICRQLLSLELLSGSTQL